MKKLDFELSNVQEMSHVEMTRTNGGYMSELSELIAYCVGYASRKISYAIDAVDWESFYRYARYYN